MTIEQITAPKQPNLSCRIELTYKEVRAILQALVRTDAKGEELEIVMELQDKLADFLQNAKVPNQSVIVEYAQKVLENILFLEELVEHVVVCLRKNFVYDKKVKKWVITNKSKIKQLQLKNEDLLYTDFEVMMYFFNVYKRNELLDE